jgi:hypothetical protein
LQDVERRDVFDRHSEAYQVYGALTRLEQMASMKIMAFQRMIKATNQCRIVLEIARHRLGIVRRSPRLTVCSTDTARHIRCMAR